MLLYLRSTWKIPCFFLAKQIESLHQEKGHLQLDSAHSSWLGELGQVQTHVPSDICISIIVLQKKVVSYHYQSASNSQWRRWLHDDRYVPVEEDLAWCRSTASGSAPESSEEEACPILSLCPVELGCFELLVVVLLCLVMVLNGYRQSQI